MEAVLRTVGAVMLLTLAVGDVRSQDLDNSRQYGEYRVYYNLINSNFLAPQVAEKYNIEQDEETAVLTVSVRAPNESGELTDQPADVSGGVSDRVHFYSLDFDEYRDPNAIYYIAEIPAAQGLKEFDFSLEIEPHDSDQRFDMEMNETLRPPANP